LKDDKGFYQRGTHRKDDRLGFKHHTKEKKSSISQQCNLHIIIIKEIGTMM